MRRIIIRKEIDKFSNWRFDDFMQRAVKASGSLKNNAFSMYVEEFEESVKEFQELRKTTTATTFTEEIRNLGAQADGVFRKIKAAADYSALWAEAEEKEAAVKLQSVLSHYSGVTVSGLSKKFVDYESLSAELNKDTESAQMLKTESAVEELSTLTKAYREALKNRDKYRSALKGKRKNARIKALDGYLTLRNKVEAFAEMNGGDEISEFAELINEALIYTAPNTAQKNDETV